MVTINESLLKHDMFSILTET